MDKNLLVNGVGMTAFGPVTKMMAHLPMAFLDHPPQNALIVCFGMGTTLSFPAFVGNTFDGGRTGTERPSSVRLLPCGWSCVASLFVVPRSHR